MELETNTTFESLVIKLDSVDEVRELQGILAHAVTNDFTRMIYERCRAITKAPMTGLYIWDEGTLRRRR